MRCTMDTSSALSAPDFAASINSSPMETRNLSIARPNQLHIGIYGPRNKLTIRQMMNCSEIISCGVFDTNFGLSPTARVCHARPRFAGRQGITTLQQLNTYAIRGTHKSHAPVTWRPIDHNTSIHEPLTSVVDVCDLVSQMPEISTPIIFLRIPIMGELNNRRSCDFRILRILRGR
jgi:hypothetical protein